MVYSQLTIHSDPHDPTLRIIFPSRVVSTNVDELREQLSSYHTSAQAQVVHWQRLDLDFSATEFVDSLGLNLIFDLVKLAQGRAAPITARVTSRAVRLVFYTVRLDRQMDILLIETPNP